VTGKYIPQGGELEGDTLLQSPVLRASNEGKIPEVVVGMIAVDMNYELISGKPATY
jgi:hypothetical protein